MQTPFGLTLVERQLTDAGLKELGAFDNLTYLMGRTNLTMRVEGTALKTLSWLGLIETKITDDGLKALVALNNLTTLYLDDTPGDGRWAEGGGCTQRAHLAEPERHQNHNQGLKELTALNNLTTLGLVQDAGDRRWAQRSGQR